MMKMEIEKKNTLCLILLEEIKVMYAVSLLYDIRTIVVNNQKPDLRLFSIERC